MKVDYCNSFILKNFKKVISKQTLCSCQPIFRIMVSMATIYLVIQIIVYWAVYSTDIKVHQNWPTYTETICGISYADRIIGGLNATLGQYPWLARIGYNS